MKRCGGARLRTELASQLWNLQPWVQLRVDAAISQMMHLPRPTIGFHLRGGACTGVAACRCGKVPGTNHSLSLNAHVPCSSCQLKIAPLMMS